MVDGDQFSVVEKEHFAEFFGDPHFEDALTRGKLLRVSKIQILFWVRIDKLFRAHWQSERSRPQNIGHEIKAFAVPSEEVRTGAAGQRWLRQREQLWFYRYVDLCGGEVEPVLFEGVDFLVGTHPDRQRLSAHGSAGAPGSGDRFHADAQCAGVRTLSLQLQGQQMICIGAVITPKV